MVHAGHVAYRGHMTPAPSTSSTHGDSQRPCDESAVSRRLHSLFNRLPALAGFRLRTDLMVVDVSAVSGTCSTSVGRLHVTVMRALVELAECDPEAFTLMRGHTFARHH